jgi:NADPH:quinone reductase-like Zn-dependent oxidoreductase
MRAAVTETFGGVDRVVVREVPKPVPGPREVLVRVWAASMNPLDCKLREGRFRLIFRVRPPFVLGFDVAGEVEAVGPGVTRLRAGDAVFGEMPGPGSHAEYAVAGEEHLLPRPARLSFEEAAALPAAGMSALQVLRELARLVEGGQLRPVVGDVFPLDAIREAHLRMQSGHARGKIVVRP